MKEKGITIIALVITIVLMLILASVSIAGAINGDLFSYAGKAKKDVEVTSETEVVTKAIMLAKENNQHENIMGSRLQNALNSVIGENNKAIVVSSDEESTTIKFEGSNRYYEVDKSGNVTGPRALEPVQYAGDITKGGTCTGTQANPYKIECIEDLVALSNNAINVTKYSGKYILLVNDLDFNSIFSYSNYKAKYSYDEDLNAYIPDETSETTIKELCTTGQGFIPITLAYGSSGETAFKGTFYGESQRQIKNLYINRTGVAALFGAIASATIKNITIDGNIISTGNSASGFVGTGWSGKIENCINYAKVTSTLYKAAGFQFGGGRGNIINCINAGEITSLNDYAAGIAYHTITINKCCNSGIIKGSKGAAGIACTRYGGDLGTIKNCYNTNTIICTGTGPVGGLTLYCNDKNLVYNSYNLGDLKQEVATKPNIGRYMWYDFYRIVLYQWIF